jgi:microcystin-dependent protein
MALIVPNATATGSGKKYLNINQAEPDSVDLESLGNSANYIRSGGVITVAVENAVTIATGVAVIGGTPYTFPERTVVDNPDSTSPRFDLVVARLTSGSVSVAFITGTADGTNPTLPRSTTVVESGGSTANTYNPTTDALIASIYLLPSTSLDTSANLGNIADKRIIDARPITYTASSIPTATSKDVVGDMVIYGDDAYIRMTSAWIKMGESTDVEQAKIPIGGMFAFAGTAATAASPNSAYYLECNGQTLSTTTYADLFSAIGYSFPHPTTGVYLTSGGSFYLPNLTGDMGVVGALGNTITTSRTTGSSTVTLDISKLPQHNHTGTVDVGSASGTPTGLGHSHPVDAHNHGITAHTHNISSHSHTIDNHVHGAFQDFQLPGAGFRFIRRLSSYSSGFAIPTGSGSGIAVDDNGAQPFTGPPAVAMATAGSGTLSTGSNLSGANVTQNNSGGLTANTNAPSSPTVTVAFGTKPLTIANNGTSNPTISVLSNSLRVRWFIRYA